MKQNIDSLKEFAKKIKSGLIYEEIDSKLKEFHSKKNNTSNKSLDALTDKIRKKEEQIEKLYDDIILLQNKLSKILDQELKK
ncbi:hypothetical protein [Leptospira meyeri]|uniref:Uncharacterized protein n=1 Tax=Leptospira meyeri TaxID=29508 RepID=A0A4R8MUN3_LEPME|nr:hypothetical protein [Leptospira meyeri]PKA22555.1 hypothetical protein CH381_30295 [Leptospira sp. mixed culture ATI2-C-A1]EKJ87618.1 hypothetical protein LEP1GSC017_1714 [Leptospira meyeri serovar Hardjo str. Went 5]EMJ88512.1 hypothetical protein LEP1GSC196_1698 [Leptospira meyeri serovar Semaranga str. Veldrot Semarang 173]MCW7488358.1 hypothetical protein [Leptospira meyeri]PJZ79778.1 hypothetical protein CH359_16315 [Leptospira meyeri]